MDKITLDLTKEEINAIVDFADVYTRQVGLQGAGNALHIVSKLQSSVASSSEKSEWTAKKETK